MKTISTLILFSPIFFIAQKEADIWYFGRNAGVEFSSGKPLTVLDGKMNTNEGCTVICDSSGKLLFYSDGRSVWNRNHEVMNNGQGLKGNASSTSSGVAIAKPDHPGIYYLFTVTQIAENDGLCYSQIDMSLNKGLGDVLESEKNISLYTPVTEKLTAVIHRNGKDIWVIAHKWKSNEFLAYLVSDKGVEKAPVLSKTGLNHDGGPLNTQGYMKSNPDGSNIALALEESNQIEMFDFDNETGRLDKPLVITFPKGSYPYGIEFSPSGSLLYASAAGTGEVYQFNLQAGSNEGIQQSMFKVGQSENQRWIGALQIANDGKIYFPLHETPFLGVIHYPDSLGAACKYENNAVNLSTRLSTLGLPTFTQSYFHQKLKKQEIVYFDPRKIELNKSIVLKDITFDFGKHTLRSSSYVELDKVAAILKKNPNFSVNLIGHTDNIGNKTTNINLSLARAKSVKQYLESKGITENRINFEGKGSGMPVADNQTEIGRNINRRVEIVFFKQ